MLILPTEKWSLGDGEEKISSPEHPSNHKNYESIARKFNAGFTKPNLKSTWVLNDTSIKKGDCHSLVGGCTGDKAAIANEHDTKMKMLLPKLQSPDYYTKPEIKELEVKERAEPGYCSHVKDFVVGRHGYGSIRFFGKIDVQQLDLNSLVQFKESELIIYTDEIKKSPVGKGLKGPAEVILLNIKCMDRKTGKQYVDGPKVDKYRDILIKKAAEQGVEFISYDPANGEWKFRVQLE